MNTFNVSPKELKSYLEMLLQTDLVPFIQGKPGIGKSEIVKSIADKFDLELIDVRLSMCDPTDLMGLPRFNNMTNRAEFVPYNMFPVETTQRPKNKQGWLLFLDEFNSASRAVQAAAFKLVLDKYVGNAKLHPRCKIICAGNNEEDGGIVNNLSTPMQSRLIHLNLEPNIDDWINDVAIPRRFDPAIIGFLNLNPSLLLDFKVDRDDKTFCCPRTWSFVNTILNVFNENKADSDITELLPLLAGTITSSVAASFIEFYKLKNKLPKYEDIINDPENTIVPNKEQSKWFIVSSLLFKLEETSIESICKYVARFDTSYQIMFAKQAIRVFPKIYINTEFKTRILTKIQNEVVDLQKDILND